jgi:hypothetical protein
MFVSGLYPRLAHFNCAQVAILWKSALSGKKAIALPAKVLEITEAESAGWT